MDYLEYPHIGTYSVLSLYFYQDGPVRSKMHQREKWSKIW
jgi:hypothetical protein